MRGHFSIEWMAQSSLSAEPGSPSVSTATSTTTTGFSTSGTHSETLPGFYCRPRPQTVRPSPEASSSPAATPNASSSTTSSASSSSKPALPTTESGIFNQETPHKSNSQQGAETAETGFSSGTEEETSGYESEGGRSLSPSPVPLPDSGSRGLLLPPPSPQSRRPRTTFTAEQVNSLERAFKKNAYLGTQDKAELCRKLNLSDKQMRNWFQNRRMKLKRTVQDALAHACQANAVASHFLHYPDLPGYRPVPYPRFTTATSSSPPSQEAQSSIGHHHPLHPYGLPATSSATPASAMGLPIDSGFYHHQYPTLPAGMVLPTSVPGHLMAGYPGAAYPAQHY